jgi:hypothetical protein
MCNNISIPYVQAWMNLAPVCKYRTFQSIEDKGKGGFYHIHWTCKFGESCESVKCPLIPLAIVDKFIAEKVKKEFS